MSIRKTERHQSKREEMHFASLLLLKIDQRLKLIPGFIYVMDDTKHYNSPPISDRINPITG